MPVLRGIGSLSCCRREGDQGETFEIQEAALVWESQRILWAGREQELPEAYRSLESLDAGGALVVPGLVDCHTHLAFGGWRAEEFQARLLGSSYLEIARAGGGILSTVRATRAMGEEALLERCLAHLREMALLGVTTVECKSGYGLDWETEERTLRVYRRLQECQPLRIVPTFLAHVVAPEFQSRRQDYLKLLTEQWIPQVAGQKLARFCDVFVEESAFSIEEGRAILKAGARQGLGSKIHADQLTDCGATRLAAQLRAVSADHLEKISTDGIGELAEAGVVAVSLPLATLYLGQSPLPARRLMEAGVPVAVATDFNPGSAPSFHLPLAMMLACTLQKMTPKEVLKGSTICAAMAVERADEIGSLEPGKLADFCIIDAPSVDHWLYEFRANACLQTYVGGHRVA